MVAPEVVVGVVASRHSDCMIEVVASDMIVLVFVEVVISEVPSPRVGEQGRSLPVSGSLI